jgi:hypothetical protein
VARITDKRDIESGTLAGKGAAYGMREGATLIKGKLVV